jgi:hypothetical protein
MAESHVYQILTPYTARNELDPGFGVLDNSANQRPDWYEYWPIRNFLLNQPLDERAYYGFLSPRFELKTNLKAHDVAQFVARGATEADVVLFSPSIHNSAYYWNVFEHGEAQHPGLKAVAAEFFARIGLTVSLDEAVSDSRNTVHSNYFVAKPRFWRAWLEVTEHLFAIAEDPADPLGAKLRAATQYRGSVNVAMKIFIMERVATLLLMLNKHFTCRARDPFAAKSRIYKLPSAIICDALKIAYATEGREQYRQIFKWARAMRGAWNLRVRVAALLGVGPARRCLAELEGYWSRKSPS